MRVQDSEDSNELGECLLRRFDLAELRALTSLVVLTNHCTSSSSSAKDASLLRIEGYTIAGLRICV